MARFDGGFTLLEKSHTISELEDKLKLVVWDWEVPGDVDTSKANLETYKRAKAIYDALRRDYGEVGKFTPTNPVCNVEHLEELCELWNKYAQNPYKENVNVPTIG